MLISGLVVFYLYYSGREQDSDHYPKTAVQSSSSISQLRNNDFRYVKPLRVVDLPEESETYSALKQEISLLIQDKQNQGIITDASVYFRVLNNGAWISINGNTSYRAGSLIKVPIMIYYLKQADKEPAILSQTRTYKKTSRVIPDQSYQGVSISVGKPYTVRELISSMIQNSDNYATSLLNGQMNVESFCKMFTDLGIKRPDLKDINYSITAVDYSKFLRVLYNATYLSPENSEFALKQMTQCTFSEGLVKKLPKDLVVAHKFGEANDPEKTELSESGIFYAGSNPYLLTVMVNGRELPRNAELLSDISLLVYNKMKQ